MFLTRRNTIFRNRINSSLDPRPLLQSLTQFYASALNDRKRQMRKEETNLKTQSKVPPSTHGRPTAISRGRQPVRDWSRIPRSTQIALVHGYQPVAAGWIDDVMPDGSGIWMFCSDDGQRRFFLREEGLYAVRWEGA